jgi:hypothetical protein
VRFALARIGSGSRGRSGRTRERTQCPVSFMYRELGVSRSGYYAWLTAGPSQRSKDDTTLTAIMKKIYAEARGNPGVRRIRAGLAAVGYRLSHKRVWRLMKAAGRGGLPARRPVLGPAPRVDHGLIRLGGCAGVSVCIYKPDLDQGAAADQIARYVADTAQTLTAGTG